MEIVFAIPALVWLIAGVVLVALEMFGASGYLLGLAAGALCTSLATYVFNDISFGWQVTVFSLLSIMFTVVFVMLFRKYNNTTDQPDLNEPDLAIIGKIMTANTDVSAAGGVVKYGDVLHKAVSDQAVAKGASVRVTSAKGAVLTVEATN